MGLNHSAETNVFQYSNKDCIAVLDGGFINNGGVRYAYGCTIYECKNGEKTLLCKGVIKYFIQSYSQYNEDDNKEVISIQNLCLKFIEALSKLENTPQVSMNEISLCSLNKSGGFYLFNLIKLWSDWKDRFYHVEKFLEGKFMKFSSNSGWEIQHELGKIPCSISHLSWFLSEGQLVVTDLQGTFDEKGYHLTDPAISSMQPGQYGVTDIGVKGIVSFLKNHKCTNFCNSLPKVDRSEIVAQCQLFRLPIKEGTTFSFINKLTPEQEYTLGKIYMNYLKVYFNLRSVKDKILELKNMMN
jgi:hypothetical protein